MVLKKSLFLAMIVFFFVSAPAFANEYTPTASTVGLSEEATNNASQEKTALINIKGTLLEIGNTTADETTVVLRVASGTSTIDKTIKIVKGTTAIIGYANKTSSLDDWIAGDTLVVLAVYNEDSSEYTAKKINNISLGKRHKGINGWIKEIRIDDNEMDVTYGNKTYTLKISANTKMVSGIKNPASLTDFVIGDRIRGRVNDDNDGNDSTWNAEIIVVLRRGETLFMRVTRWVVPAELIALPDDVSASSSVITVKILPNKMYEKGDVNNLIGKPGDQIDVKITSDTKLRRRFMGKTSLEEFVEGDKLLIIGRFDNNSTELNAVLIKNNSIQALNVSRIKAVVDSVDSSNNTIIAHGKAQTDKIYTIKTNSNTEFYKKTPEGLIDASFGDMEIGATLRMRGVLNKRTNTITASKIICQCS